MLLLSGPVGVSRWALGLLKAVQKELKLATWKIKEVNSDVIQRIGQLQKLREQAVKADEV